MILNDFELENYLFEIKEEDLNEAEKCDIIKEIKKRNGRNILWHGHF